MARKRKGAADDAVEFESDFDPVGDEWVEGVADPPADAESDVVGSVVIDGVAMRFRRPMPYDGAYYAAEEVVILPEDKAHALFRTGRAVPVDGRWP